ncbi:hypothetical protein EV06_1701 [Prochlorococcus sp. MIT 0602]|nr:hypothetical protein EV06_1701 [Prochlorococcus sp. MIT 0602]KGG15929.1 hypothetical protein EV07_1896 [Prochlorococcus sp. MIT 0603]
MLLLKSLIFLCDQRFSQLVIKYYFSIKADYQGKVSND